MALSQRHLKGGCTRKNWNFANAIVAFLAVLLFLKEFALDKQLLAQGQALSSLCLLL
jgi:hypothetical protein